MVRTHFQKTVGIALRFLLGLAFLIPAPPVNAKDVHVSGASFYVTLASGVPWAQLNANYIFTPQSTNTGLCIFVENLDSVSHTITLSAFQTGDNTLAGFDGNQNLWAADQLISAPTTIPANTMDSSFVNSTGAASVAIVVSGASGTGSASIFVVQSSASSCGSAGGAIAVQGAQSFGQTPTTNPVITAGVTSDTNKIEAIPLLAGSFDPGLELGFQSGLNISTSTWRTFGLNSSAPSAIATGLFVDQPDAAVSRPLSGNPVPISNGILNGSNSAFVQNAGQAWTNTVTINAAGTTTANITTNSEEGVHQGCVFVLDITGAISGTSPTLDVYIQDSQDNSAIWDDRVHFAQLTSTSAGAFTAAVTGGSITPRPTADATLAAGTVQNGQLEPFLRAKFVAGGASPHFPIEIFTACQ